VGFLQALRWFVLRRRFVLTATASMVCCVFVDLKAKGNEQSLILGQQKCIKPKCLLQDTKCKVSWKWVGEDRLVGKLGEDS
jgi:hypothetical protein